MRVALNSCIRAMAEQGTKLPPTVVLNSDDVTQKDPFVHLRLSSWDPLKAVAGRTDCPVCGRSRKFYCYTCYVLVGIHDNHLIPTVKLPVKVDIIKHPQEVPGKSTAIHARILAPNDVSLHIYPDIPHYKDTCNTLLLFPKEGALSVSELNHKLQTRDLPLELCGPAQTPVEHSQSDSLSVSSSNCWGYIDRLVVIDSTWNQTNAILKDDRIKGLQCVKLGEAETHFWRPQRKDEKHLATIEAIYYFFREMAHLANSSTNRGHYDNLLYFYAYQHGVVQQAMQEKTSTQ